MKLEGLRSGGGGAYPAIFHGAGPNRRPQASQWTSALGLYYQLV